MRDLLCKGNLFFLNYFIFCPNIFPVSLFSLIFAVKKRNMKQRLLFVCLGNICRSPAAEGIMKSLVESRHLGGEILIDSAGIGSWHIGQLPDSRMRRHGAAHGYTFDSRARQITPADFDRFDYIVVMDSDNYRDVQSLAARGGDMSKVLMMADFLTSHPHHRYIPDPYYGGDRDFELVIELLEDACQGLLEAVMNHKL